MTKIKLFFLFLFTVAALFFYATSKKSDWFISSFINYDKHLWPKTEPIKNDLKELERILNQPFFFLGSGNQTFAFVSRDEKYVLKFFKFQHLKNSWIPQLKNAESRNKRINQVFLGHSLGILKNKENSGILFAHLNADELIPLLVTVYGKNKSKHSISLNDVVFIIQKKGESSNVVLSRLFEQKNLREAKVFIRSLLNMYLNEYSLGLFDRDHNVMHNSGFCEGTPMHIDVGKLRQDENMKHSCYFLLDLKKIAWKRIDPWMKRYYPQYRDEIAKELNIFLHEIDHPL